MRGKRLFDEQEALIKISIEKPVKDIFTWTHVETITTVADNPSWTSFSDVARILWEEGDRMEKGAGGGD